MSKAIGSSHNQVLAEPFGRTFTQILPTRSQPSATIPNPPTNWIANNDSVVDNNDLPAPESFPIYVVNTVLRHQDQQLKRERQWSKWANETIPSLLEPYLRLLRESCNLRDLSQSLVETPSSCTCGHHTSINITCVYLERKTLLRNRYFSTL